MSLLRKQVNSIFIKEKVYSFLIYMQVVNFTSKEKNQLRQWIPIILILLLASFLYFFQLGAESIWLDESSSIEDARKLFSDFSGNFSFNRPLYYILLYFWMQFGNSEAWLRGLSVLFALGSVFLTYILGCRLYSKATGLIAALLLTLSPLAINHSQEVRMYMMSTCLGIAGSLVLTYLLETPNKLNFIYWLSLRFLAVLTTSINILLLVPDLLLLCYQLRQSLFRLRKWYWLLGILLIPAVLALVDIVPPLIDFFKSRTGGNSPNFNDFVAGITEFTVWPLKAPWEGLAWFYEYFFKFYAVILFILLGFTGVTLFRKQASLKNWYPVLWGFFPVIAIFLLSQIVTDLYGTERYILLAAPYILLLVAEGFVRVFRWQRQVAFCIMLIYLVAAGSSLIRYYTVPYREDWRSIVQMIKINEQPNDAIALFPHYISSATDYYYKGSASIYPIEPVAGNQANNKIDIEKAFRRLPSDNQRYWLVLRYKFSQQEQAFESVVEEQYKVQKHIKDATQSIDLYLVTPHPDQR